MLQHASSPNTLYKIWRMLHAVIIIIFLLEMWWKHAATFTCTRSIKLEHNYLEIIIVHLHQHRFSNSSVNLQSPGLLNHNTEAHGRSHRLQSLPGILPTFSTQRKIIRVKHTVVHRCQKLFFTRHKVHQSTSAQHDITNTAVREWRVDKFSCVG